MGYKMGRYVAFFDLDSTILDTSSGKLYLKYRYDKGFLSLAGLILGSFVVFLWLIGLLNIHYIIKKWIKKYEGTPERELADFSNNLFNDVIINHIRKDAINEINFHKNNQARIVLLSAATSYICDPIKKYLKIDDVICTQLDVQNGIFTGRLLTNYCYGEEKLKRAEEYCRFHGFEITDAFYYADSYADVFVFEKVGNPVCVSPDNRLKRLAVEKAWKIDNW